MAVIEWIFGFLVELFAYFIPELIFELPRTRLQKSITKKAKSLGLSARELNDLAKKPKYTITDNGSGGFDFFNCSYRTLKRLWGNIQ